MIALSRLKLPLRPVVLLPFFLYTYIADFSQWHWAARQAGHAAAIIFSAFVFGRWSLTRPLAGTLALKLRALARRDEATLVGALAIGFFILTCGLSWYLFDNIPHVADTHAQYVHAKIMAGGHLYLNSHPYSRFFDFQNMVNDGRYYSVYAPGHVLLLALGRLAGAPWITNPLMGSLTVTALYLLARELGGKACGLIAAALMLTSPFMVFMSSEYMNNVTCEFFLTLFLYFYIRQHKTNRFHMALFAGLCVGYAFITRPQTTLPFALPLAFHALYVLCRAPRERLAVTLALLAPFLFFTSTLLLYNIVMNDNAFVQSGTDPLKFLRPFSGMEAISGHIAGDFHRLRRIVIMLHQHLLGWPFSSLLCVLLLYLVRGQRRYSGLVIACCLAQLASLIVNPFFSTIFGPRYLYETSTGLIALTALCIVRLPSLLRARLRFRVAAAPVQGGIALGVILMCVFALLTRTLGLARMYGNNYFEGNESFYRLLMSTVEKPALVFFKEYPEFRWVYFTLPPSDDNPVIVAQDLGVHNRQLIEYYSDRSVYSVDKGLITRLPATAGAAQARP